MNWCKGSGHGPSPGPAGCIRWEPHGGHQLFLKLKPCAGTPTLTALHILERRAEEKVKPHSPKLSSIKASTSPTFPLPTVWHLQLTSGWLRDRHSTHSPHQSRAAEVGACPHPLPSPIPPSSQLSLHTSHHLL